MASASRTTISTRSEQTVSNFTYWTLGIFPAYTSRKGMNPNLLQYMVFHGPEYIASFRELIYYLYVERKD